jgi:hypothetical protein
MKGMCQTCGAVAPIEWFLNEPIRRQFEAVLIELPKPVQVQAFAYLALFRPATGRSITPKKAHRLLSDLRDLVKQGYVSRAGNVDRPCPPQTWAAALEIMANQRHSLTLPLPNHKYLLKVAYDQADQVDRQQESRTRQAEASGNLRRESSAEPVNWAELSAKEWANLPAHIRAKHQHERAK